MVSGGSRILQLDEWMGLHEGWFLEKNGPREHTLARVYRFKTIGNETALRSLVAQILFDKSEKGVRCSLVVDDDHVTLRLLLESSKELSALQSMFASLCDCYYADIGAFSEGS